MRAQGIAGNAAVCWLLPFVTLTSRAGELKLLTCHAPSRTFLIRCLHQLNARLPLLLNTFARHVFMKVHFTAVQTVCEMREIIASGHLEKTQARQWPQ